MTVVCCLPALAWAQAFRFEPGNPVASQDFRFKTVAFVFRTTGCADPAHADVSATAEGIVNGTRRSIALKVSPSSKPGVYAVPQQWEAGRWAVILSGTCGHAKAGAIIPFGVSGSFVREASKYFPHPPTSGEVEAALKAFPEGGYK